MSACEQSAALSRLLTTDVIEQLADLASSMPEGFTVREFMRKGSQKIRDILCDSGLVDPRKHAEYFTDDGDLTERQRSCWKTRVEAFLEQLQAVGRVIIRQAPWMGGGYVDLPRN